MLPFKGCSMVPLEKSVWRLWMDNLVSHSTVRLSFRKSTDLCHTDIGWTSGTANCTAGCSKTQRLAAIPACLDPTGCVQTHASRERNNVRNETWWIWSWSKMPLYVTVTAHSAKMFLLSLLFWLHSPVMDVITELHKQPYCRNSFSCHVEIETKPMSTQNLPCI